MISQRQCMRPRESVDPMYIPGRLRTASRPSSTWRWWAEYSAVTILKRIRGSRQPLPDTLHIAVGYAQSEMSPVRGILETNAWLYFLPASEFYTCTRRHRDEHAIYAD